MKLETKKQLKISGVAVLAWLVAFGVPSTIIYFVVSSDPRSMGSVLLIVLYFFFFLYMVGGLLMTLGAVIFNLTFGRWIEKISES